MPVVTEIRFELPEAVVDAIVERVVAVFEERAALRDAEPVSEYMTPKQAAELLCCARQRIDDLLSQRRLSRFKEGGRTLLLRAEVLALVELADAARTGCRSVATVAENGSGRAVAR